MNVESEAGGENDEGGRVRRRVHFETGRDVMKDTNM